MENFFIQIIKVLFLGIVEGLTEWLPVSSTGHLILVDEFIRLDVSLQYLEMFRVVIQFGAILAVLFSYFSALNPISFENRKPRLKRETIDMWLKIIIACMPAAIVGLLFDDLFNEWFYNYKTVAIMLILIGIVFIIVENKCKNKTASIASISQITYKTAFLIGIFQLVAAIFPGTSRSGATIIGALMLGVSRTVAAQFSFFLAVPIMLGASGLKLFKFGLNFSAAEIIFLLSGMLSAFLVSIIALNFLLSYVAKHDFKIFGWYRIILGIIVLLYFAIR